MLESHESDRGEMPTREGDVINAVFDTVNALVMILDAAGRIVRFNRACEQTTGYRLAEVEGQPFWDVLLVPEEVESVKRAFAQLQAGPFPSEHENHWVAKEGSQRLIAWSAMRLAGESGSIEYIVTTGIDITEHRRAQEERQRALDELRQRQAELSALLDGARQVLEQHCFEDAARSIFDTCKGLIGATAGYVALSSKDGTQNEVLFLDPGGRPCTVDPALPMPIRGLREQVHRTGTVVQENDFWSSQWTQYLPEGHVSVDNVLFAPLVIKGRVVGLLGLANKPGGFTENDARLAAAFGELAAIALHNSRLLESLEAGERRFRSVAETANAAIAITDNQGQITFWNHMAEMVFGYTAEEMIGTPLTRIIPERFWAAHQSGMEQALMTGLTRLSGETVETVGARKGGIEFPLQMSLATWKTGEGTFFTALMHDISQRRQSEEALREAKQSIEMLIQASPLAITAVDPDLKIRLWNPAAERIFGWSESEVLGRPCPFVPEAKREEFQCFLTQTLAGSVLVGEETVGSKKDGSSIDISLWTAPLQDAAGTVRTAMVIIADISERKQAEARLHHYAREQAALYAVTSALTSTLDQEELLPVVLDAVLPVLKADAGWILLPGFLPSDPLRVAAERARTEELSMGGTILAEQYCPVCQGFSSTDSTWIEPYLVVDCPILLTTSAADNRLHRVICLPLQVGQNLLGVLKVGWRQPSVLLEQDHDLLVSIGRQVSVALYNAQLYHTAQQVNRLRLLSDLDRALAATLDPRKLADVTLHHLATHLEAPAASLLLLPPASQPQLMRQVFTPTQGWTEVPISSQNPMDWPGLLTRIGGQREPILLGVGELVGQDGALIQHWGVHALVVPIWGESAQLAVLVLGGRQASRPFTDEDRMLAQVAASHAGQAIQNAQRYHEIRRLLHEQEQTRAQLIQIAKVGALGRLAATVAHEINNPLQAVESCLTLIREEMDGDRRPDKLDQYLEVAEGEVRRISAIVRRLRDYYRPAHEGLHPTDLLAVLDGVLELSSRELRHRQITVEQTGLRPLPLIQANPDHLKQVFLNLVLNAVEAMPEGGTLRIHAGLGEIQPNGGERPQPAVRIEISDTGHGMSPEVQARLFEPFFTTKKQGTGLGLSISHSIIEAHNGQISVTSKEGAGTTFSILLPVGPA